ncbi:MAG: M48 family metalloprotease [Gammaproteobacteria bacterium]|nr:M48 family metalloprotease [Gammaproteobacteria bacterium]
MKPSISPFLSLVSACCFSLLLISQPVYSFDFNKLKSGFDKIKQKKKDLEEHKKSLDLATGNVSKKDEINIGRNVMSGLLGAAPLVKNDKLQQYVNKIGYWIALQSERPDLPWSFGVINSPNVNAFAAPGGYIVLTLGLYQLLENESQLAGLLAHEISHVIKKDHLDAIRDTSQTEILGALAVKATSSKHKDKMQKLVNSSVQIYARGLDKKYEYGADRRGAVLAARAGYDPYALLDVLTTLRSINSQDDSMTVFLNTHPPLATRIETLGTLMDKHLAQIKIPADNRRLSAVNKQIAEGR